jgi:hypothetical protein
MTNAPFTVTTIAEWCLFEVILLSFSHKWRILRILKSH